MSTRPPPFDVISSLTMRNSIETYSFKPIYNTHRRLLKEQQQLSLSQSLSASTSNSSSPTPPFNPSPQKSRRNLNQSSYWSDDSEATRLGTELASLRKALDETTELLSKSQRSNMLSSSKITELQGEIIKEKAALKTSSSEITTLQTLNQKLNSELTTSKSSEDQLINRMISEKQNMIEQVQETTDLCDALKGELEMVKQLLEDARAEIKNLKSQKGEESNDLLRPSMESGDNCFLGCSTIIPKKVNVIFRPHASEVMDLKTSGGSYLTAGSDSYLKLIRGGNVVSTFGGVGVGIQPICCCDISSNIICSGGVDKVVRCWEEGGRGLGNMQGHGGKIVGVRVLEGKKVVSVAGDRRIKVWDLGRRGSMVSTNKHPSSFTSLSSPQTSGDTCSTGHSDGGLRIWDLKSNTLAADIPGIHNGSVTDVKYHPEESSLVFCLGRDNLIKVVDLRMCEILHTLSHPDFRIGCNWTSFGVSPDGVNVACGSVNGDMFVWDVREEKMVKKLKGHREQVVCVVWGGGEGQVVSGDKGGSVIVWH
ncbi:hypothetical protein TL16_g13264 [Triparma laevis f. inornata]|uniref:Uncharacterized protein n=2 Tax=Triparma laevis TaxID=1534972 RepID=A0A9W7AZE6_9STRA|nr:hypothetical protein TrLO_g3162 [Triparma laevis f. longispina]GMH96000.1 hypothetical protein TL16_g13264 [Triparma laevis f. inornata]